MRQLFEILLLKDNSSAEQKASIKFVYLNFWSLSCLLLIYYGIGMRPTL